MMTYSNQKSQLPNLLSDLICRGHQISVNQRLEETKSFILKLLSLLSTNLLLISFFFQWFAANKQNDGESMNFESPIEDSSVSKTHFHASHLYYTSKFLEASQLFVELLKKVPLTNFQLRREVSEGLSRSLMKLGKWDEAVEAANEFVILCLKRIDVINFILFSIETQLQKYCTFRHNPRFIFRNLSTKPQL